MASASTSVAVDAVEPVETVEGQGFQLEDQQEPLLFDSSILHLIDQCVGDYFDDPSNVIEFYNGQFDLHDDGSPADPGDSHNQFTPNSAWNKNTDIGEAAADKCEDQNLQNNASIQDPIETSTASTASTGESSRKRKLELEPHDETGSERKRRCSYQNQTHPMKTLEAEDSDSDATSESDSDDQSEDNEDTSKITETHRDQQVPSEGESGLKVSGSNKEDQKAAERRQYSCKYCDKLYARHQHLKRHIKHNHNFQQLAGLNVASSIRKKPGAPRKQRFHCSCCTREFRTEEDLTDHQNVINGNKSYVCQLCKASFYTRQSLHTHKKSHTDKQEKRFYCKMCNKAFGHKNTLAYHKTHVHNDGIKDLKLKCEFCNKRFLNAGHLKQHLWSHEKPSHPCPLCDQIFKNQNVYRKHLKVVHNGGKGQFKCDQCKAQFDRINYLNYHKRIHQVEK